MSGATESRVTNNFPTGGGGGGISSLNGLVAASQTFATGSAGLAPAFISAVSTHTLNIPLAAGAGVTAGLISKTDYDFFAAKVSGPAGAAGNSICRFDGISGSLIQDSTVTIADTTGAMTFLAAAGADVTWDTDGAGSIGLLDANRPSNVRLVDKLAIGADILEAKNFSLTGTTLDDNQYIFFNIQGNFPVSGNTGVIGANFNFIAPTVATSNDNIGVAIGLSGAYTGNGQMSALSVIHAVASTKPLDLYSAQGNISITGYAFAEGSVEKAAVLGLSYLGSDLAVGTAGVSWGANSGGKTVGIFGSATLEATGKAVAGYFKIGSVDVVGNEPQFDPRPPVTGAMIADNGDTTEDIGVFQKAAVTVAKVDPDGNLRTSGNLGVGNFVAATTLGNVIGQYEIFDFAGASSGFVAVYDAIT